MKKRINTIGFGLLAGLVGMVFLSPGCQQKEKKNQAEPLVVYAAASLTDVIGEIIDSFEIRHQVRVRTNLASSGTLARQMEQGGDPDIYISASLKWADYIDRLGLILPGFKSEIARNALVFIAPKKSKLQIDTINSSLNLLSLLGNERLSMGDPSHVPAGQYALQSLNYYQWYENLNNRILPAKDVRSALMMIEIEESPLGIVYQTDAFKSKGVKILKKVPEESYEPISYIAGLCRNSKYGKEFFLYLQSDEAKGIWEKYGFKK